MSGLYIFPDDVRRVLEAQPIALVYDQYIDGKVVPLLVSDGFCQLVGKPRDMAMAWFAESQFERVHPDDVGSLKRISDAFARHEGDYNMLFRARHPDGYHYLHAIGKWQIMPDGTELALLCYSDVSQSKEEIARMIESYRLFQQDAFYTDTLTGLPNINYLRQFGEERVHALRVEGKTPMLIYCDVNAMRFYNTQYGLARGDELLRLIGQALGEVFPDGLVTRASDDHFVVLDAYPGEAEAKARILALNERVKTSAFGATTGIQAGIFAFEANSALTAALDHAKSAQKRIGSDLNQSVRIFSREAESHDWQERYILDSFPGALQSGFIKVYYQGIDRLETGKCAGFEALARWVDPVRGIISPGEFIPVLEKYHLLYKLDLYMMEQVCREIPIRMENKYPPLPVTINFAAQDFDYIDVPAALNEIYARHGIEQYVPKDFFVVEITEQDIATATERFHEAMRELKRSGFRLWLDDFGSGYSSLNVFSKFDIDLIKFDMDLLRNLDDHGGLNRRIITALAGVARESGIHTLVEGMETEEQRQFLKEAGIELAQGYLFHRPEPLDSFLYRLHTGHAVGECETDEERDRYRRR